MYTRFPGFLNQEEHKTCSYILSNEGDITNETMFVDKLFNRIQRLTKKTFKLICVYSSRSIQDQEDFTDTWTFILYMNSFNKGGETEFVKDEMKILQKPVMNLGVLFFSDVKYNALAPLDTTETRLTVLWKLQEVPKYTFFTEPVPHCIIRNYYNDEELEGIWEEIEFLKPRLLEPGVTGAAEDENGNFKKNNRGIFLENVYGESQNFSNILKINKLLGDPDILSNLKGKHWFYNYLTNSCDKLIYSTLISYYSDGGYYKPHTDSAVATCISYHWREPKKFRGGDLYFGDYRVPIENNCMIIFPSCTEHEVTPVDGNGRCALTQFMSFSI